jgi:hypothetical protein
MDQRHHCLASLDHERATAAASPAVAAPGAADVAATLALRAAAELLQRLDMLPPPLPELVLLAPPLLIGAIMWGCSHREHWRRVLCALLLTVAAVAVRARARRFPSVVQQLPRGS